MVKKIAVSIAEPIFREMERTRKRLGKTRSAWLQDTVSEELRRRKLAEDVAAYVRSYEEHPETEEEIAAADAAAVALGDLYPEDEWPEAPR